MVVRPDEEKQVVGHAVDDAVHLLEVPLNLLPQELVLEDEDLEEGAEVDLGVGEVAREDVAEQLVLDAVHLLEQRRVRAEIVLEEGLKAVLV